MVCRLLLLPFHPSIHMDKSRREGWSAPLGYYYTATALGGRDRITSVCVKCVATTFYCTRTTYGWCQKIYEIIESVRRWLVLVADGDQRWRYKKFPRKIFFFGFFSCLYFFAIFRLKEKKWVNWFLVFLSLCLSVMMDFHLDNILSRIRVGLHKSTSSARWIFLLGEHSSVNSWISRSLSLSVCSLLAFLFFFFFFR